MERPSGEIYSFDECRRRNRYLERTVDEMRAFAEKFVTRENLSGPVFIGNSKGSTRDDSGVGFAYPDNPEVETRLNRSLKAKLIKDWAQGLPPDQREEYLEGLRSKGWEGLL